MFSKRGFTLIEVIVVLAIIVILTALIAPAAASQIGNAQAVTCAANRRSIKSDLSINYITTGLGISSDVVTLSAEQAKSCPGGGTISAKYEDGDIIITCSKHSDQRSFYDPSVIRDVISAIQDAVKKLGQVDSNTVSDGENGTDKVTTKLDEIGIDLEDLDAVTWQYKYINDDRSIFYWTDVDISTLPEGTQVPVLRYNSQTGTYTVWISTVGSKVKDEAETKTYNALNTKNGKFSEALPYKDSTDKDKVQTYETALKLFKQAQQAYPLPG